MTDEKENEVNEKNNVHFLHVNNVKKEILAIDAINCIL